MQAFIGLLPYSIVLLVLLRWLGYFYLQWGPDYPPANYIMLATGAGLVEALSGIIWVVLQKFREWSMFVAGLLGGSILLRLFFLWHTEAIHYPGMLGYVGLRFDVLILSGILFYCFRTGACGQAYKID